MSVTNVWDALTEFKNVVKRTKSIQNELEKWGDHVIQFIVKGGEDCNIMVRNGQIILEKGKKDNPDLTFTALDGHLVKLITGQEDYTSLDILGNITFQGNEADKHKFIGILGLFVDAILGETEGFDEFE
ncbi:MAG: SCP2 sterol-binding domain-containing protein [Candidatus Helarchaeota archaeon]